MGVGTSCLARVGIYDIQLDVHGYEILYWYAPPLDGLAPNGAEPVGRTGIEATTLLSALGEVGLDALVGDRPAWVSGGEVLAADDLADLLPPERTVVVLTHGELSASFSVKAISKLRSQGYRIAADDQVFEHDLAADAGLVDVVVVDVLAHRGKDLDQRMLALRERGLELLAANVATYESFERCRELGFSLFEGRFLATPRVVPDRRVSAEASVRVQLAAQLNDPDADFDQLAALIAADVTLSYRLLRYINSAHVGLRRPVVSLREALVVLGTRNVRSWASMLLMSDVGTGRHQIVATALLRAHMCQSLAQATGEHTDRAFLVGLLSVADALTDRPLADAIDDVPIDGELKEALLGHAGPLGELLKRVLAFEHGDFATAAAAPLDTRTATGAYLEAISWSSRTVDALAA